MQPDAFKRSLVGAGLAAALVLSGASVAQAATTPTPSPTATVTAPAPTATATTPAPTATPTPSATTPAVASVVTIKGRTAGTGTNFSGTYRVGELGALVPAEGRIVDLQRKTPTGWDTVTSDAADVNGNLVYGTVRSHFVQTWRLVSHVGPSDADYGVSPSIKVAQNGKAVSSLKWTNDGFRAGKGVGFNGDFTYRSWWITSGPDDGKQGFVEPLGTHVYLQYKSGSTWKNKKLELTEDGKTTGTNLFIEITTKTTAPRTWRLYYPGSATRTSAVTPALKR